MIRVAIHPSQFPDRVRRELIDGLLQRRVRHKFHYESRKQSGKWLALHEAHSPARTDPDCRAIYDRAFAAVVAQFRNTTLHVVGLGCGGGQKDAALIERLRAGGNSVIYTAVDVSLPLVITAHERVASPVAQSHGVVCDLETADDLHDALCECAATQRIVGFFGMIPNSEPEVIFPRLRSLVSRGDLLLVSANLAPGADYAAGVRQVLPQYDNTLTADWLMTVLYDLGVERDDGRVEFRIEECAGLFRIRADFRFLRGRTLRVEEEKIEFAAGEAVQLFFSYRYTPELLQTQLSKSSLGIEQSWVTTSGEEGVFLVTAG